MLHFFLKKKGITGSLLCFFPSIPDVNLGYSHHFTSLSLFVDSKAASCGWIVLINGKWRMQVGLKERRKSRKESKEVREMENTIHLHKTSS